MSSPSNSYREEVSPENIVSMPEDQSENIIRDLNEVGVEPIDILNAVNPVNNTSAKNAFAALNEVSAYARGVRGFAGEISEAQRRESCKSNAVTPPTRGLTYYRMNNPDPSAYRPFQIHRQKKVAEVNAEDVISSSRVNLADIESNLGDGYYINYKTIHPASNALDVISLYIKGQKLLYTEAKTYCEQQLNFLMLPAIFISCVSSIFSFISEKYNYGPVVIACLNGFNAFLLALISYLKLDAKAQAHKTSAYKFDKLESYCEFNSGKFMFFDASIEDIFSVVEKIEKDVKEIKETNQFILPESIRYEFQFTYSTNVFIMIKRMHSREIAEIQNLKNCMNILRLLGTELNEAKNKPVDNGDITKITARIEMETKRKNELVNIILIHRKDYYLLDDRFKTEIEYHTKRVNRWFIFRCICCDWLKS
jgi:hypothetical protein